MTHLIVENQNSNTEIVSVAIILKLYNLALGIEENLEEGESLSDYVSLKGNLLSDHAKLSAYDYLTGNLPDSNNKRFPNLTINLTGGAYIDFADSEVERVLLANNIGDGTGITTTQATLKTGVLDDIFWNNTNVITLDDLLYFPNISGIGLKFATNCSNLESVIIPSGVLNISEGDYFNVGAFRGCANLSSVTLNEGLLNIDNRSFMGCTSLSEITIPSTVTKIGKTAGAVFRECTGLEHVYGGTNVEFLAAESFYGCAGLRDIAFSSNLTTIEDSAFEGCSALGSINISSVLQLGSRAFFGCSLMTSVTLNPSLTAIPDSAFANCTSLTSIDLSNVTMLKNNVFYGCTSLTDIGTNLSNVTSFEASDAFKNCPITNDIILLNLNWSGLNPLYTSFVNTRIRSLTLKNISWTNQGGGIDYQRSYIPSTSSNYSGIGNNSNIQFIDIQDSADIKVIENDAFDNCTSLHTIKLPSTLTSVGQVMIRGCNALKNLVINATTPVHNSTINEQGGPGYARWGHLLMDDGVVPNNGSFKIFVPDASQSTYKSDSQWGEYSSYIYNLTLYGIFSGTQSSVPADCFKNDTSITSADFTNSNITSIGESAFEGCTGLTSIDLSGCTSLPGYPGSAFKGCTSLTTVTGLENLTDPGIASFQGCTNLGRNQDLVLNITNGNAIANTFRGTAFKTVTLHAPNMTSLYPNGGDQFHMFYGMNELLKLDLSDTKLTVIQDLSASQIIVVPDTVTSFNWQSFSNIVCPYYIILATTPPSINDDRYYSFASDSYIYVPDAALTDYQTAWSGNKCGPRLKAISELPSTVTWATQQSLSNS